MTKRLILMRHAKSDWSHDLADHDRPLNKRGKLAAQSLGDWLRENGFVPDQIWCSSAKRTCETFEGLALDIAPLFTRSLYLAEPADLMAAAQASTGDCVLLIAHNPGIAWFAHQLLAQIPRHPKFAQYPTGATLVVDFDIVSWDQLQLGRGQLVDFVVPRELSSRG